jgi:hypothetical protein
MNIVTLRNKSNHLPTAVTRDLGFRLNLKMILYLKVQSLIESFRLTNPQLLKAAKRCAQLGRTKPDK